MKIYGKSFTKCLVLYFTDSPEKEASLQTANDVYSILSTLLPTKILMLNCKNFLNKINKIDKRTICFIAAHGGIGENGVLQSILRMNGIYFTHSDDQACAILSNKHASKLLYRELLLKTPNWIFQNFEYGKLKNKKILVEKPIFGGSKFGVKTVKKIKSNSNNIYEELIYGNLEVGVGVLGSGKNAIALEPVIKIRDINKMGKLKQPTYEVKIDKQTLNKCKKMSLAIHKSLNCHGITKTDFILDKKGNAYVLETDAIPGFSKNNMVSIGAGKIGIGYKDLVIKVLKDIGI